MAFKVLVTGSSGFIGGYLVEEALNQGYEVWAGLRKTSSKIYLTDERINFLYMDFENQALLLSQLKEHQFDYIIHNAGLTKAKDQKTYDKVNVTYLRNLVSQIQAAKLSLKKFIFMSSLAALGPGDDKKDNIVRNDSKAVPVTAYGRSKKKAEDFLKSDAHKLEYIGIRPTAVYGPREKDLFTQFEIINKGIELHVGLDKQFLSFIYVEDLVRLIFIALKSKHSNKFYLVSDGNKYNAKMLNALISEALSKSTIKLSLPIFMLKAVAFTSEQFGKLRGNLPPLNSDKVNELKARNWVVDTQDLVRDFNFHASVNLEEGIKKTADWYLANGWLK